MLSNGIDFAVLVPMLVFASHASCAADVNILEISKENTIDTNQHEGAMT